MLDGISLDQLRTFIAAADEGSFSAAGRKLNRAQSVVSQALSSLEAQLDVLLFDRSNRYPRLTEQGAALLTEARIVVDSVDALKARARTIADGLEPELSVVVDVMYPMSMLTEAVIAFKSMYPVTPLRLFVEALGAVAETVDRGICRIGVVGTMPSIPSGMDSEKLLDVTMVAVAAPSHPLAGHRRVLHLRELEPHVQLILTDRSKLSTGHNYGVMSPLTWKLADLGAKLALLRAGLGFGYMPLHMVTEDLATGGLVRLRVNSIEPKPQTLSMIAVYPRSAPPGPAGRFFIERLKRLDGP